MLVGSGGLAASHQRIPTGMFDGLGPARMMSAMSSEREFEALVACRFQRRTIGIGARQEITLYVGGRADRLQRTDGGGGERGRANAGDQPVEDRLVKRQHEVPIDQARQPARPELRGLDQPGRHRSIRPGDV